MDGDTNPVSQQAAQDNPVPPQGGNTAPTQQIINTAPSTGVDFGYNPIVDIAAQQKMLNQTDAVVQQGGQKLIDSLASAAAQAPLATKSALDDMTAYHDGLKTLATGQATDARNTIVDANKRILQIKQMPMWPVVSAFSKLAGYPDLDVSYQQNRKTAAAQDLQSNVENVNILGTTAKASEQKMNDANAAMAGIFGTQQQLAGEARANAGAQDALSTAQFVQSQRQLESMTPQQLQSVLANPTQQQKLNVGPGLVQQTIQNKQQFATQLEALGVSLQAAKGDLKNANFQRQGQAFDLALDKMDYSMAEGLLAQAKANGGYAQINPKTVLGLKDAPDVNIPISTTTLQKTLATKQAAAADLNQKMLGFRKAVAETPNIISTAASTMDNLNGVPEVTSTITAPKINSIKQRLITAQHLSQTGSGTDMLAANGLATDASSDLDKEVQNAVGLLPEPKRPGTQEFIASRTMSPVNATPWLANDLKDTTSPLVNNPNDPYAYMDSTLRGSYKTAIENAAMVLPGTIGPANGKGGRGGNTPAIDFTQMNRFQRKDTDLFENAVATPQAQQAKAVMDSGLNNTYMSNAMHYLASSQVLKDGTQRPPIPAFMQFYSGGNIMDAYTNRVTGSIDTGKVLDKLAADDVNTNGSNIQQLQSILNNKDFRQTVSDFEKQKNPSSLHAAYRGRFYNNDSANVLFQSNGLMNAIKQSQAKAQAIKQQTQQQQQNPGVMPNAGKTGWPSDQASGM